MSRHILVTIISVFAMCMGVLQAAYAEEYAGSEYGAAPSADLVGTESAPADAGLVNLAPSKIRADIQGLDLRIKNLEQENRFLKERVRNLDRIVNDLRRRR